MKKRLWKSIALVLFLSSRVALSAEQLTASKSDKTDKQRVQQGQEQSISAESLTGLFEIPFEELMNKKVSTASFIEKEQLTAEAATSVVTRKEWEKQGTKLTFDALQYLPGTQVYPYIGGSQAIAIRGYTNLNSNRRTAILLDGIPLNLFGLPTGNYGASLDLGVLERIEVLRGAGSPIYGSDAFFGVAQIFSQSPKKDCLNVEVKYGNFNYSGANLRWSHGFSDQLRLTLLTGVSGQALDHPSYYRTNQQTYTLNEKRDFRYWTNIGKLNFWKNGEVEAIYGYYNGNQWFPTEAPAVPVKNTLSLESKLIAFKFANTWEMSDWASLVTRSYYWTQKQDFTGLAETEAITAILPSDESRIGAIVLLQSPIENTFPLNWRAGYSVDFWNIPDLETILLPGGGFPLGQIRNLHATRAINALLFELDAELIPGKLTLLTGARYDVISTGQTHFSPRGGLVFQPDPDSAVKLLYGNAFRSPSYREQRGAAPLVRENPNLQSETIDSLELNYLTRDLEKNLFLSAFYSNWDSAITFGTISNGSQTVNIFNNSGRGISYGVEYEFKYHPSVVGTFLSGAYVRSADITAERREYSAYPVLNLNWGLDYQVHRTGLSFNLFNRHNWFWTDNPTSNSIPLKPYFRTDFSVQWEMPMARSVPGKYGISLNIRNLFNREIYTPGIVSYGGGIREEGINLFITLFGQY